jgi:outer membrane protein assembly factor BamB
MPPLFPLLTTLLLGGLLAWMWMTDNVMRSAAVVLLGGLWFLMNGMWWALRKKGARWQRLAMLVLVMAGVVVFFRFAVRYEGSADGSAWPQLAFKWQKKDVPIVPMLGEVKAEPSLADVTPPGVRDMPRFLGAKGDGVLPAAEFSTDWTTKPPREVWRIQVGPGWSGFAVVGHRAITQEQRGELECVTCYDIRDGKLLWSHTDKAHFNELMGGEGPRAVPTVDSVAGRVFTMGGMGMLNCLDLATGEKKWQREVLKDGGASRNLEWGKSSSPLLTSAHVICSAGDDGASLIAYDRETGNIAWKAGNDGGSYASPVLFTLNGREQIVTVNRGSVSGHDPVSGAIQWQFEWPGMFPKVAQPQVVGEKQLLITSSYGLKSHLLEIEAGSKTPRVIWAESNPRTKFSSASVFGDHAYAIDEGTLCCVSLKTGERVWREGRYGFGQHIRVGDDLLLIQAEKGPVVLVRPSPEKLVEIARLDALKSKTWNPPTLAGRWLLLRNDREAVCYELAGK